MVSITLRVKSENLDILPMFTTEEEVSYASTISSLTSIRDSMKTVVKTVAQDGV